MLVIDRASHSPSLAFRRCLSVAFAGFLLCLTRHFILQLATYLIDSDPKSQTKCYEELPLPGRSLFVDASFIACDLKPPDSTDRKAHQEEGGVALDTLQWM